MKKFLFNVWIVTLGVVPVELIAVNNLSTQQMLQIRLQEFGLAVSYRFKGMSTTQRVGVGLAAASFPLMFAGSHYYIRHYVRNNNQWRNSTYNAFVKIGNRDFKELNRDEVGALGSIGVSALGALSLPLGLSLALVQRDCVGKTGLCLLGAGLLSGLFFEHKMGRADIFEGNRIISDDNYPERSTRYTFPLISSLGLSFTGLGLLTWELIKGHQSK